MEEEEDELDTYSKREAFCTEKLGVSPLWFSSAKAALCLTLNLPEEEAWHLLRAGSLAKAHALLCESIAPQAIIDGEYNV